MTSAAKGSIEGFQFTAVSLPIYHQTEIGEEWRVPSTFGKRRPSIVALIWHPPCTDKTKIIRCLHAGPSYAPITFKKRQRLECIDNAVRQPIGKGCPRN